MLIRRICVRYEDDRKVCFVPEAGEEYFSQDDAHRLVGMLHKGSEALEWGLSSSQRNPGTGPYDTGAVRLFGLSYPGSGWLARLTG